MKRVFYLLARCACLLAVFISFFFIEGRAPTHITQARTLSCKKILPGAALPSRLRGNYLHIMLLLYLALVSPAPSAGKFSSSRILDDNAWSAIIEHFSSELMFVMRSTRAPAAAPPHPLPPIPLTFGCRLLVCLPMAYHSLGLLLARLSIITNPSLPLALFRPPIPGMPFNVLPLAWPPARALADPHRSWHAASFFGAAACWSAFP
jgi:hypothetical protein